MGVRLRSPVPSGVTRRRRRACCGLTIYVRPGLVIAGSRAPTSGHEPRMMSLMCTKSDGSQSAEQRREIALPSSFRESESNGWPRIYVCFQGLSHHRNRWSPSGPSGVVTLPRVVPACEMGLDSDRKNTFPFLLQGQSRCAAEGARRALRSDQTTPVARPFR
jgi:hypothetical protein